MKVGDVYTWSVDEHRVYYGLIRNVYYDDDSNPVRLGYCRCVQTMGRLTVETGEAALQLKYNLFMSAPHPTLVTDPKIINMVKLLFL